MRQAGRLASPSVGGDPGHAWSTGLLARNAASGALPLLRRADCDLHRACPCPHQDLDHLPARHCRHHTACAGTKGNQSGECRAASQDMAFGTSRARPTVRGFANASGTCGGPLRLMWPAGNSDNSWADAMCGWRHPPCEGVRSLATAEAASPATRRRKLRGGIEHGSELDSVFHPLDASRTQQ